METKKYIIQGNGTVPGVKKEWQEIDNEGKTHSYISVEEHESIQNQTEEYEDESEMDYDKAQETSARLLENEWKESEEYETPEGDTLYAWLEENATSFDEKEGSADDDKSSAYGVEYERTNFHFIFEAEMTQKQYKNFQKWSAEQDDGRAYDIVEDENGNE